MVARRAGWAGSSLRRTTGSGEAGWEARKEEPRLERVEDEEDRGGVGCGG